MQLSCSFPSPLSSSLFFSPLPPPAAHRTARRVATEDQLLCAAGPAAVEQQLTAQQRRRGRRILLTLPTAQQRHQAASTRSVPIQRKSARHVVPPALGRPAYWLAGPVLGPSSACYLSWLFLPPSPPSPIRARPIRAASRPGSLMARAPRLLAHFFSLPTAPALNPPSSFLWHVRLQLAAGAFIFSFTRRVNLLLTANSSVFWFLAPSFVS